MDTINHTCCTLKEQYMRQNGEPSVGLDIHGNVNLKHQS
jgi:hypothetical protein